MLYENGKCSKFMKMLLLLVESQKSFDFGSLKWPNFRMKLFIMGHCGVINGPEVNSFKDTPAKKLVKTLVQEMLLQARNHNHCLLLLPTKGQLISE